MKSIIFTIISLFIINANAGIGVGPSPRAVQCNKEINYSTNDPDFVADKDISISAQMTCSAGLPSASDSFEDAKMIAENTSCNSIVASTGTHVSFVVGFERIVTSHDILGHSDDSVEIIAHKRCVQKECGPKGSGCSCVHSVDAPELGFTIKVGGLTIATNKTTDLSVREYTVTQLSFNQINIFAGEESTVVDGVVQFKGKPQRLKYTSINHDIGPETKNLSYDSRNLNFKDINECQLFL